MTISGTIAGSYNGYANRYEVQLIYSYDQDTVANTSTVSASLQIRSKTSAEYGAWSNKGSATLSFGGYSVTWNPITFDFRDYNWHTVISMNNKVIQHSNDGTKVLQFASTFYTNDSDIGSITSAWANGSVTLQKIDRYSTFGTLTPFVIEQPWSVPINKYVQAETDTLTIEYGTFSKTITPYVSGQTIQFTAAELSSLYAITTNISTIPFDLTITTGSLGSSTATLNGTITPVPPTFTATITTSPNSAVSGQTNVAVTLSAAGTAHEGGTIIEYVVSLGSQTIRSNSYSTTFSFTGVDGDTVTAQAVDSRGWASAPITKTITLYPYNAPTVSASVSRTPTMADTSAQLSLSGTYSVVPNQTLTGSYRYRTGGGAWSNATTITLTYSSGSYSFSATLLDTFNIANAYEFEITVTDLYQSTVVTTTLLSAEPTIDLDTSTQRVKIGGFLGSEDNQSLSVVGDIYEGGVKLEDKYGGLGGSSKTLLWTNPSPTATFAAQTVVLNQDSSSFDAFLIIGRYSQNETSYHSNIVLNDGQIQSLFAARGVSYAQTTIVQRDVTISGTSAVFTKGQYILSSSYGQGNQYFIPLYIYGINFKGPKGDPGPQGPPGGNFTSYKANGSNTSIASNGKICTITIPAGTYIIGGINDTNNYLYFRVNDTFQNEGADLYLKLPSRTGWSKVYTFTAETKLEYQNSNGTTITDHAGSQLYAVRIG